MKQFVFSLLFKGDAASAKAAAKEAVDSVASVNAAGKEAQEVSKGHALALEQEAAAQRSLARAALERAQAEKSARDKGQVTGSPASPVTLAPERLRELRERFVPLEAAQKAYAAELDTIALAERAGALTADESAAARQRLSKSFDESRDAMTRASGAAQGWGRQVRLAAHQQSNLNLQLSDTFQTIALGMPPMQVLLQQGPQIVDVFGGIGNTARAAVSALTPMRLLIGGIAGVALIGATSWNGYLRSIKEVETAAAGLGRGMAASRAEMEASARAGANAASISIKAARQMQATFLRTGRIDARNFEGLIGISKDFAATIGVDAQAAGAALADIFADPTKGADTLYRQYGLISAATMQLAKDLAAQNRQAEAQAVLMNALPDQLAEAEKATTGLGRAWDFVGRMASGAGDAIGAAIDRGIDGPDFAGRLAELRRRSANADDYTPYGLYARATNLRPELESDYLAEFTSGIDQAIDRAQKARAQEEARRLELPLEIATGSSVNASAIRERELRNQIAALQSAAGAQSLTVEQEVDIQRALESKTRALAGLIDRQLIQGELDRIDIQLMHERNPLLRAELTARQSLLNSAGEEILSSKAYEEAVRARNRVMNEAIAGMDAEAAGMRQEYKIRQQLAAQVAAGTISQAEANRLLQEELILHPLVAAAAAAQGDEQAALNRVIRERRELTAQLIEQEKRSQADESANRMARSQGDDLARLRLEAMLITATNAERRRALDLQRADAEIRDMGLAAGSARARQLRDEALAISDLRAEVDRLSSAWATVDSAASGAIDGAVDSLVSGDLKGALNSIGQEILATWTELSLKNPIKNAILGQDLPTMQDVGGIAGIWGRLTGKAGGASGIAASLMNAPSMSVNTPIVQLMAGQITGLPELASVGGVSAVSAAAGAGSSDVQGQIWQFFAQKGLQPHQIAGILGNVAAESAFNPLAVGDGGTSFGLFQHHAGRGQDLLAALGGASGLSNIQGQLEHVWRELLTSESGVLDRLKAAPDVNSATQAFVGFERPQGWSSGNPTGAMHWDTRLASAEAAMAKFEGTVASAGQGLGQLGTGFEGFGSSLSQMIQGLGARSGPGGIIVGGLLTGLGRLVGIPGFDRGGWTGAGHPADVAGLVHAEEYVFDAAATRRIGVANLDAIRRGGMPGYRAGGYVVGARPPMPREAQAAMADRTRQPAEPSPVVFNMNISGTGDAQIMAGVRAAVQETFDYYDRHVFAGRVRMVLDDPRGE